MSSARGASIYGPVDGCLQSADGDLVLPRQLQAVKLVNHFFAFFAIDTV